MHDRNKWTKKQCKVRFSNCFKMQLLRGGVALLVLLVLGLALSEAKVASSPSDSEVDTWLLEKELEEDLKDLREEEEGSGDFEDDDDEDYDDDDDDYDEDEEGSGKMRVAKKVRRFIYSAAAVLCPCEVL